MIFIMKKVILSLAFCLGGLLAFANGNDPKVWQEAAANATPPESDGPCVMCARCKGILVCATAGSCYDAIYDLNEILASMGCQSPLE